MKHLQRCDVVVTTDHLEVVTALFVGTVYTTRRWGWLLGRSGYSIAHHYPLLWTHKEIGNELNITPVVNKIQDSIRNWMRHVNRMPRNRSLRVIKKSTHQKAGGTREEIWRDFWLCETGTGQQMTQLHDSYMMMKMMTTMMMMIIPENFCTCL